MKLISPLAWQNFVNLQNDSHDDYMTGSVVWKRSKKYLQPFAEDYSEVSEPNDDGYDYIPLPVLFNYNVERTWPITQETESGEVDRQSIQLYFSYSQLAALDSTYINANKNFNYDPAADRFIINGIIYHGEGDTPASQTPQGDLVYTIIVRPDLIATKNPAR